MRLEKTLMLTRGFSSEPSIQINLRSAYVTPVSNNELQCNLGNMWGKIILVCINRKLCDVSASEVYCSSRNITKRVRETHKLQQVCCKLVTLQSPNRYQDAFASLAQTIDCQDFLSTSLIQIKYQAASSLV